MPCMCISHSHKHRLKKTIHPVFHIFTKKTLKACDEIEEVSSASRGGRERQRDLGDHESRVTLVGSNVVAPELWPVVNFRTEEE